MYQQPDEPERPSCRDALVLTRAVFAIVLPVVGLAILVISLLTVAIVVLTIHPALALLPLVGLAIVGVLFVRWERRRMRPPDEP